jgi:hypothetical protein
LASLLGLEPPLPAGRSAKKDAWPTISQIPPSLSQTDQKRGSYLLVSEYGWLESVMAKLQQGHQYVAAKAGGTLGICQPYTWCCLQKTLTTW